MMHRRAAGATKFLPDIQVSGHRLEAASWTGAANTGTPVLLLHEGLGSVGLWRSFPAQLAASAGADIFAFSRAGYGQSDPCPLPRPLDYMAREAALLPQITARLTPGRHILLGHSDGASIAALAAAERPPDLAGLILIAPHFFVEDISIRAIRAARQAFDTGDLRARLARHHGDPDTAFRGWNDAWLDPAFRHWDIRHTIARWQVPVLAIQGTDDPYGTEAQVAIIGANARQAEVHMIPDCGHAPHHEAEAQCLDLIAGFMRRVG